MTKDEWYKQLFERLGNSKFRSSFHLKQKDIDYMSDIVKVVIVDGSKNYVSM